MLARFMHKVIVESCSLAAGCHEKTEESNTVQELERCKCCTFTRTLSRVCTIIVIKCKQLVRIGKRASLNAGKRDFLFHEFVFFIFQCRAREATVKGRQTLIDIYLFFGSLNKVRERKQMVGALTHHSHCALTQPQQMM